MSKDLGHPREESRCCSGPEKLVHLTWVCSEGERISHFTRSAHSMRAKNGWDLMSSTPATPAPRRSAGLNCKSCWISDLASFDTWSGMLKEVWVFIPDGWHSTRVFPVSSSKRMAPRLHQSQASVSSRIAPTSKHETFQLILKRSVTPSKLTYIYKVTV